MMRHLAWRHFERGRQFELQNRVDEAIDAYRSACGMRPEFPEPYFALGRMLAGKGSYDEALAHFDEALACADSAEVYEWRGYVHGCLRQYDDALLDYQRAIDGGETGARINMGRMLLALRRYDEAEAVLADSEDEAAPVLLEALPRYREFAGGDAVEDPRAVRYLFGRTVVLGSRNDGGLPMARMRYVLLTAAHVARTVSRFTALAARRGWRFDAVVGTGAHHGPAAALLAAELDVPHVAAAAATGRVLLVSAVVEGPQEARILRKTVAGPALHFALAFTPAGQPSTAEPDVVGMVCRAAVPWYRVAEHSRLEPDAGAQGAWPGFKVGVPFVDPNRARVVSGLQAAFVDAGEDRHGPEILDWYCERHPQVRAFDWENT